MNSADRAVRSFRIVAAFGLVSAVIGLAALWPGIIQHLHAAADHLAAQAEADQASDLSVAALKLEAASWLRPSREIAYRLADLYLAAGRAPDALRTLDRLTLRDGGERMADILFRQQEFEASLRIIQATHRYQESAGSHALAAKNLLELERYDEALDSAQVAHTFAPSDGSLVELIGLVLVAAGRVGEIEALKAPQSAPEAARTLKSLTLVNMTTARLAYAQGLLITSERLARPELGQTSEAAVLLAEITLAKPDMPGGRLEESRSLLAEAIKQDVANPKLYELDGKLAERLGDTAAVQAAKRRLEQLQPPY